jgi:hypothetical protein
MLASCPGIVVHFALPRGYRQRREQVRISLYAVRHDFYPPFYQRVPYILFRLSLKYVAEGGNIAEEVISTIRTAHAFGTQTILSTLYGGIIEKSLVVNMKAAIFQGAGQGAFFFVIYAAYAVGEYNILMLS